MIDIVHMAKSLPECKLKDLLKTMYKSYKRYSYIVRSGFSLHLQLWPCDDTPQNEIYKNPILVDIFRGQFDKARYLMFYLQIKRILDLKISGDFAELGVKAGLSAKFIHGCAPERKIHLFDTFEGFDDRDMSDLPPRYKNAFKNVPQLEDVAVYLNADNDQNIVFHKGYFPDTTKDLENENFAFVHIDVDLYNPTKAGCEFFFPRLSPGATMIFHDYVAKGWVGVKKAVDEYFEDKKENVAVFPDFGTSAIVIKNS